MVLKVYFLSEGFAALRTRIASTVLVMRARMLLDIRGSPEAFSANVTCVWLLPAVTPSVFHQSRFSCRKAKQKSEVS